jgi:hypothetical protein
MFHELCLAGSHPIVPADHSSCHLFARAVRFEDYDADFRLLAIWLILG